MENQIHMKEGFEFSSFIPTADKKLWCLPVSICGTKEKVACHNIIGDGTVVLPHVLKKLFLPL